MAADNTTTFLRSAAPSLSLWVWGSAVIVAGVLGLLAGIFMSTLLPARYAASVQAVPILGILIAEIALVFATHPRWVFAVFLFFCVTTFESLEKFSLPLGFMKLFVHDAVFGFNILLIAIRTFLGRTQFRRIPYNKVVIVYFLLGIWALVNGWLLQKHPYDKAFGDFRRAFFYFMNYFVTLYLIDSFAETRALLRTLLLAGVVLLAKGFYQVATGQFYFRRAGDAAHVLSHIELTFLSLVVFYALVQLVFNPHSRRWLWATVFAAGTLVTIIGNYRASWLGLAAGILLIFCFLPARRRLQLTLLAFALLVVAALALYALWDTDIGYHTTLGEQIAAKADVSQTALDVNVIWRFQSYQAAIEEWKSRPWLGTGLGKSLEFHTLTTMGQSILAFDHRVHNSQLWLFMSLGVIGFPVAVGLHAAYLWLAIRYLRRTRWSEGKGIVLSTAAFYCSMMVATSFEIFLETTSTVTILSVAMAITMLTIYYGEEHERRSRRPPERASGGDFPSGLSIRLTSHLWPRAKSESLLVSQS